MADVDRLQIEIEASSNQAEQQIRSLTAALKEMKSTLGGNWKNPVKNITAGGTNKSGGGKMQDRPLPEPEKGRAGGGETGEAEREADRVSQKAAGLQRLKSFLKDAGNQLSETAKKAKEVLSSVGKFAGNGLGSLFSRAVSPVKNFAKGISNIASSFQRIFFYRAIRTLIKQIGDAFKTGINNVYQWNKALGGSFAQSMDSASASIGYFKNSLGAAAAPILSALIPALNAATSAVVTLINAINQLFAALGGGGTYIRAVKANKEFAKSAGGAAKAARDFTLGIDELNVIKDDAGGGGGGGGTDFGGMFEYASIDEGIAEFADRLREAFNNQDWFKLGELLGDKVNEIFDMIPWDDMGRKLGTGFDAVVKTAYSFLKTVDFSGIGSNIASMLNNAIENVDFEYVGRLMVRKITAMLDFVIGFVEELDFYDLGEAIGDYFRGALYEATEWLNSKDWESIGYSFGVKIGEFIKGIDFDSLAKAFWEAFKAALKAAVSLVSGIFDGLEEELGPTMLLVEGIGAALLGWTISTKFISGLSTVIATLKKAVGFVNQFSSGIKAIGGVVAITVGTKWSFDAGYEIGKGTAEVTDYIKAVLGPVAAGIGGALLGSVIPGIGTAGGFAIGLGLGVVFEIAGIFKGENERLTEKFYQSDFERELAELQERIEQNSQLTLELDARIESINTEIDPKVLSDLQYAQQLLDDIFTINEQDNLTAEEFMRLQGLVSGLNSLGLEGLQASFDETGTHIAQTKGELQGVIDKLMEQYKVEAMREAYIEAYRAQFDVTERLAEANVDLKDALDKYNEAQTNVSSATEDLANAQKALDDAMSQVQLQGIVDDYSELEQAVYLASLKLQDQKTAFDETAGTLDSAKTNVKNLMDEYDKASKKVELVTSSFNELASAMEGSVDPAIQDGTNVMKGYAEGIETGSGDAKSAMEAATQLVLDAERAVNGIASPSKVYMADGEYLMEGLAKGITNRQSAVVDAMKIALEEVHSIVSGKWDEAVATTESRWGSIANTIIQKFSTVKPGLESEWAKISKWWSGLTLEGLKVKVPSFSMSGKFDPESGSTPSINVNWRWMARGGIVDGATLIGAGEAGKEAIIPLERNTGWIDNVADRLSERQGQSAADEEQTALLREQNELLTAILAKTGVTLDGKTLTASVEKYQRSRGASIMAGGVFA